MDDPLNKKPEDSIHSPAILTATKIEDAIADVNSKVKALQAQGSTVDEGSSCGGGSGSSSPEPPEPWTPR